MTTYLLTREYRKNGTLIMEYVLQYSEGDMAEVFSPAERETMAGGKPVERDARYGAGKITFTDMMIATRNVEAAHRA